MIPRFSFWFPSVTLKKEKKSNKISEAFLTRPVLSRCQDFFSTKTRFRDFFNTFSIKTRFRVLSFQFEQKQKNSKRKLCSNTGGINNNQISKASERKTKSSFRCFRSGIQMPIQYQGLGILWPPPLLPLSCWIGCFNYAFTHVTAVLLASKFSLKQNPFHSKEICLQIIRSWIIKALTLPSSTYFLIW